MDSKRTRSEKKNMKTFKDYLIKESIIDIPRRTYAPGVFDNADSKDPKIKPSVKELINKQIEVFEKEYPVIKIALIGSILTKRYRNDADLDINILFDVPKDKQEDERVNLSQKYLSAKNFLFSSVSILRCILQKSSSALYPPLSVPVAR